MVSLGEGSATYNVLFDNRLALLLPVGTSKEAIVQAEVCLNVLADLVDGGVVGLGAVDVVGAGDEGGLEDLCRRSHDGNGLSTAFYRRSTRRTCLAGEVEGRG